MTREAKVYTAVAAAGLATGWVVPPAVGWVTWGDALTVAAGLAALVAWTAAAMSVGVGMARRGENRRLDVALALRAVGERDRIATAVARARAEQLARFRADTDVALDIIREDT